MIHKPSDIELIDMAINMLNQARASTQAIDNLRFRLDSPLDSSLSDALLARYCYKIVRSAVGVIEVNTKQIQYLSNMDFEQHE